MASSLSDLKKDALIQLGGVPYRVVDYQHSKIGRGGAMVRTKLKNLADGSLLTKTFKGSDKVEPATLNRLNLQFMYKDESKLYFMDRNSYEQVSAATTIIGNRWQWLNNTQSLIGLEFRGQIVALDIPPKVKLTVTQTDPAVRGDTTGNALKPAEVETGAELQVPLFIKTGDQIVVDTRSGTYLSRV